MTYVVTENCIRCKFMDCVAACPVDCFHEGENMLVIHPENCIDCGVCEPECPADAIRAADHAEGAPWVELNARYAQLWPVIAEKKEPPADAEAWMGRPDKFPTAFSAAPAAE